MGNKKIDCEQLHFAIHNAVENSDVSASSLARESMQKVQTVVNRLNFRDTEHVPTVEDLVMVVDRTGDTTPIEVLCNMFDGRFMSKSKRVACSLMQAVLEVVREQGDVGKAIEEALAGDNDIDNAERVAINREIDEEIAALTQLKNTINQ